MTRIRSAVEEAGALASFGGQVVALLPTVGRHFSEVLRQCAFLVLGTTAIVGIVTALAGAECTLYGYYALRSIGAEASTGTFSEICGVRAVSALFFGYIFAAKVGCGLVAEIGSMRIGDELDAFEAQGLDPMRYVVGTRVAAILLCLPLLGVLTLGATALGAFLVATVQLGDPSQAAFSAAYWSIQTPLENVYAIAKITMVGAVIAVIGAYYGYRAHGGAVGVGAATARSMVVNIVLLHAIDAVGTTIFFGAPLVPFGG